MQWCTRPAKSARKKRASAVGAVQNSVWHPRGRCRARPARPRPPRPRLPEAPAPEVAAGEDRADDHAGRVDHVVAVGGGAHAVRHHPAGEGPPLDPSEDRGANLAEVPAEIGVPERGLLVEQRSQLARRGLTQGACAHLVSVSPPRPGTPAAGARPRRRGRETPGRPGRAGDRAASPPVDRRLRHPHLGPPARRPGSSMLRSTTAPESSVASVRTRQPMRLRSATPRRAPRPAANPRGQVHRDTLAPRSSRPSWLFGPPRLISRDSRLMPPCPQAAPEPGPYNSAERWKPRRPRLTARPRPRRLVLHAQRGAGGGARVRRRDPAHRARPVGSAGPGRAAGAPRRGPLGFSLCRTIALVVTPAPSPPW